jgi:hypothetical protein
MVSKRIKKIKNKRKTKIKKFKGGTITQEDIMYQDALVCILRPDVKKGIIVWTNYVQPPDMPSLCEIGLKTGHQLNKEGIGFGRSVYHPHIFFRAPYYSRKIDYSTIESEVVSSYGEGIIHKEGYAFIRVDPDRTFVFSSEIRAVLLGSDSTRMLENSKKTLTQYLGILNENEQIIKSIQPGHTVWYNLFSSKATIFKDSIRPKFPLNEYVINRNSEILVSIPHLTPDFFVLCNPGKSRPSLSELYKPIGASSLSEEASPFGADSLSEARPFKKASLSEVSPFGEYSSFDSDSLVGEASLDESSSQSPESTFKVIVRQNSDGDKVYECPACHSITGTAAPKNPRDFFSFSHRFGCPNKNKIPVE